MGIYVNPGNENFRMVVGSKIYVDKTGLIEYTNDVIGTEQRWVCVSRPRRFGKSIAAEMIAAYYGKGCDSGRLFQPYVVARVESYEKYLNQYDVIHLDITNFRRIGDDFEDMLRRLNKEVIGELQDAYPGILKADEDNLPHALACLNESAKAEFVIIIDEWDAVFREDKNDLTAQKEYIELLRGLFKSSASKRFVKLAYITGILPVKKYGTESALNNFYEFTMINPKNLSKYVGFTEDEVRELCKKYGMDYDEMKKWYDGYSFRRIKHIYNPNSVVQALLMQDYDSYWSKTETYESLKEYISMNFDGLKDAVVRMLAGGRCKVNTDSFENDMTCFKNRDDVLTALIHLGYLGYDRDKREAYIPNEEIRSAFSNAILKSDWSPVVRAIQSSERLLEATWRMDCEAVAKGISDVHKENTSILAYNDENAMGCVIALAYYNAVNDYTLVREMPTGKGYADVVFLPRRGTDRPTLIVELKYGKSAGEAIEQIKKRNYANGLKGCGGKVLLVGVNYDRETKEHECLIEVWER